MILCRSRFIDLYNVTCLYCCTIPFTDWYVCFGFLFKRRPIMSSVAAICRPYRYASIGSLKYYETYIDAPSLNRFNWTVDTLGIGKYSIAAVCVITVLYYYYNMLSCVTAPSYSVILLLLVFFCIVSRNGRRLLSSRIIVI